MRRELDFYTGEEVIQEIERLRCDGYEKTKNWNLSQICEHLTGTMRGGMDGFGFRLPWILRATLVKWIFRYSLRRRKLFSGAPTLPFLKPNSSTQSDDDQVIDECIAETRRAMAFDGSLENYALLDNLTVEDWQQFMWLHASHHLSFLKPNEEP